MSIELDHAIAPPHHKVESAKRLAELLDVPWAATSLGPFAPVFVNEGLTLDFHETADDFPVHRFCFRVDQPTFDAVLARVQAAGIAYRSAVHGPVDRAINTEYGGSMVYWTSPTDPSGRC